jgi:serine/threonine protein phosphatase PrpC
MVTDPEIASTLMTVEPAQAAADRLVELANDYGGEDNVTVIVLRVRPGGGGLLSRLFKRSGAREKRSSKSGMSLLGGS